MPRPTSTPQSKVAQAKAYARDNGLSYDAAYHLMLAALAADGVAPRGVQENAPAVSELSTEDAAALAAAKSALSLS